VFESRRRDRVLEIDENMLRREIGRMKSIREGEARDMAYSFGGGSLEGEAFVDGVELNKLHEIKIKAAKVIRRNRMLESKLSQYNKALRGMKGQLSEMNLFNAKLLYANKLMQNRDLSIKQQRHIVESLDEAKTMGEAKILFESLSKSLVSSRPAKRGGNLTEGAIRRRPGAEAEPGLRLIAPSVRFPPRLAGRLLTSDLERLSNKILASPIVFASSNDSTMWRCCLIDKSRFCMSLLA
jgi:hypothetical protein